MYNLEQVHEVADSNKSDLFLITSMAQTGAAALYRRMGYVEDRWLMVENPTVQQNFTTTEKYIYGDVLGFFEYGFFRKSKENIGVRFLKVSTRPNIIYWAGQ